MQIREMELRTGLDRANIRYYEKMGLLIPRRSENGYREYTEEDVETLERIKLLRELELSIEDIRRLQREEVALTTLMGQRLGALGLQAAELVRQGKLCKTLYEDNVSYQCLDAGKYRRACLMETSLQPVQMDKEPRMQHPWRRLFARALDLSLALMLWDLLWYGLLDNRIPLDNSNVLLIWLGGYLPWLILLFLEPLLLSRLGTTPGKWIFGLSLTHDSGRRLTYGEAMGRIWVVLGRGYGWAIPIYSWVCLYKSWRADERGEPLEWEEDSLYAIHDTHWLRSVGYVAASMGLVLLSLAVSFQSMLPPNRGALSQEDFVENINDYYRYFTDDTVNLVDGDGRWIEAEQGYGNVRLWDWSERGDFSWEEVDGRLTAVRYTINAQDSEGMVRGNSNQMLVTCMALAGAQKGVSGWKLVNSLNAMPELSTPFAEFNREIFGLTIENRVTIVGYENSNGNTLFLPTGIESGSYRQEFAVFLPE